MDRIYSKKPSPPVPSDTQAREKLALYVYEYLCHVGAKEAAQTFLNEMHWHKQISVGEPPGFLHSWWCVFWDLYCAAPERRESCDHSTEAKAFHDYGFINSGCRMNGINQNAAPSPLGMTAQGPGSDGLPPGPASGPHPGFFPPGVSLNSHMRPGNQHPGANLPSPSMIGQQGPPFLNTRFPGGNPRPGMRLPPQDHSQPPFSTNHPGGQPVFPDQMGLRQGQGPPGIMTQRMPPSAVHRMMNPNFACLRPPPGVMPSGMPMNRPWQPSTSGMPPMSLMNNGHPQGPGTPIMPSPQMADGSAENLYLMKVSSSGAMGPGFSMNSEPSSGLGELMMNGDGMDIKPSPGSCHGLNGGTPGPGSVPPLNNDPSLSEYSNMNAFPQDGDQNESAAILKIKECMAEEAKRFEKLDNPSMQLSADRNNEFFSMQ